MRKWPWFLVAVAVIFLDQASKYWILMDFSPYQPEKILPMLNITLAYNTGAAFSFLSSAGEWHRWFFTGFSVVMCTVLSVWIVRTPQTARLQLLALNLVLGGAVGNLIDRIRIGYVIDFIEVYYKAYHWPVFNLADSAICVGAFFLLLDLRQSKKQHACCNHTL